MKVLFLPKYNAKGPSSRYRFYNYAKYFDNSKVLTVFKPLLGDDYIDCLYTNKKLKVIFYKFYGVLKRLFLLLFKTRGYDLLIIEKELIPNFPYYLERLLLRNRKFALDFDDYIAVDYKTSQIKRLFLNDKINHLVRKAKFVTVGNHWYFEEFKTSNLKYLPTVIDIERYPLRESTNCDVVTIVWIGSPSTSKYLEIVKPVLQELSMRYDIVLKVIGADVAIEGVNIILVKWSNETEVQELLKSDIGIMPLYETLWENGKCGFKLIQYMASSMPVVSSPAPANIEIIDQGINGYIAKSEMEWFQYLEKLILDSKLRVDMGIEGRKKIEKLYSYQIWGNKYVKIIMDANS